ncbi:putative protein of unknown function (DUF3767) [Lyophyllum shimeji]|uniref:Cytochrome c oxidase assembly protein COX20, mitochondrial n=1 Tax=Lyophyllum shimeji TaxID=47721 RepID=A0A9P3PMN2_LYOSH|nr:putative protein of unknown function (DUF3767) [Lyophyllum shimeji]
MSSSDSTSASSIPPPPSRLPPPTGNFLVDVFQSVTHFSDIPCARNSLLGGIASGAGIGVVRGISSSALVAGNWAMATFVIVSLGSYHLCQKQMADERKVVTKVIESMPRRVVKQQEGSDETTAKSAGSAAS